MGVSDTITRDRASLEDSDQSAKRQKTTATSSTYPNLSMSLSGKVYAVTGGASGIGLATAKLLAARGATVCIADVDPEAMKKAEAHFSAASSQKYSITRVDVSQRSEVDAWIDGVVEKFGRLDGAANIAGIIGKYHGKREVAELDDDDWNRIISVNLTGTMYCLRAELRKIVDGGSIVNITSIHGLKGFAKFAAYDASKHGVIGLTRAAAQEVGPREIRINAVAPGAIYTPLMEKAWKIGDRDPNAPFNDPSSFQRQGTAEEVGNVIAFLLGPESTFVSGSVYSVDGCWI
ncbi:hypothetical protein DL546_006944 [Coniochaeta pulveracea]|uniref:Uncharacterized protein n=1 Tax=Coniochaeta pulveracea TaxID=177199 RepID=A0A420YAP6_9PEZI|nr:hypothetical protein DL546_006944 [Coniochaeta pulveracea]